MNHKNQKLHFNMRQRTPRWVKMFGIIALVLALLFVILHLTGRGLGGHASGCHGVQQP